MTAPTQAQIDRAAKAMYQTQIEHLIKQCERLNKELADTKAALTAAAQAGDKSADKTAYVEALNYAHAYDRGCKDTIERCAEAVWDAGGDNVEFHCAAIRALTAAAQVEKDFDIETPTWEQLQASPLTPHGRAIIAATIERCARVIIEAVNRKADGEQYVHGPTVVAAIRALKDKP